MMDLSNNKNGPIFVWAALCLAALLSALFVSAFLFIEMLEMETELKEGMAQFKILTDQSWEALFQEEENGRPRRQASSSYFASFKGATAPGGGGNCQCAPSAQNCPKGVPGPAGEKGEPGFPGQNGPPGKPGASGGIFVFERVKPPCVRCPPGEPGQKGRPGPLGRPGPDGLAGENGKAGKDGQAGQRGAPGEHGQAGQAGNTGEPGPPGESVSTWAKIGTPGAKGSLGPAGPPGEPGPPGKNGQPGRDGLRGPAGQAGTPGETGTAGIPGNGGKPGKEAPEKNYCPCPTRSEPTGAVGAAGPNYSASRRGVRTGEVKLRSEASTTMIGGGERRRFSNSGIV